MKYFINQEQFDKIIEKYFDKRFKDSFYETMRYNDGQRWTGFWVDDETLLIGHPELDDSGIWFSNGRILDGWTYFDIDPKEFYLAMERYLNKKYGIKKIQIQ